LWQNDNTKGKIIIMGSLDELSRSMPMLLNGILQSGKSALEELADSIAKCGDEGDWEGYSSDVYSPCSQLLENHSEESH
jgi:hypothetical protein